MTHRRLVPRTPQSYPITRAFNTATQIEDTETGYLIRSKRSVHHVEVNAGEDARNIIRCYCPQGARYDWVLDSDKAARYHCQHIRIVRQRRAEQWARKQALVSCRVLHPDLYQIQAYTVAAGRPRGMLIYTAGEAGERVHRVRNLGKVLEVRSLALVQSPEQILAQVDMLARRIVELRNGKLVATAPATGVLVQSSYPASKI